MKISTKGRYALRVMLDLAINADDSHIPLKEIAARQGITVKYLEQIISILTKAGFVKSIRGNAGGYMLTRSTDEYIIGDILRAAEGSLAPIYCVEPGEQQCDRIGTCLTFPFWKGLNETIKNYVDSVTLTDLIPDSTSTEYFI